MSDSRTALLVALAAAAVLALPQAAAAQSWRTVTSARQTGGNVDPVEVQVDYHAGELRMVAVEQPLLYSMEMRYDEEQVAPVTDFDADFRRLTLGVRSRREDGRSISGHEGSRAVIALSRTVPLELDLDFGAGEAELDLGGVALRRLNISTGASETTVRFDAPNPQAAERLHIEAGAAELTVLGLGNLNAEQLHFQGGVGSTTLDFSGAWSRDARASVQMGIGAVRLRFPRSLGVRIDKDSFLTSFDGEGLVKRGSSYFSPNWDQATHQVTVDIDAAFGSIEVEWID